MRFVSATYILFTHEAGSSRVRGLLFPVGLKIASFSALTPVPLNILQKGSFAAGQRLQGWQNWWRRLYACFLDYTAGQFRCRECQGECRQWLLKQNSRY